MPIAKGKTTKGFRACQNKGFHIRFPNGWIVSVQFGSGNYCENYNFSQSFEDLKEGRYPEMESKDAEVWCFNDNKKYPEEPLGNQTPLQVLEILNKISKRKLEEKK